MQRNEKVKKITIASHENRCVVVSVGHKINNQSKKTIYNSEWQSRIQQRQQQQNTFTTIPLFVNTYLRQVNHSEYLHLTTKSASAITCRVHPKNSANPQDCTTTTQAFKSVDACVLPADAAPALVIWQTMPNARRSPPQDDLDYVPTRPSYSYSQSLSTFLIIKCQKT